MKYEFELAEIEFRLIRDLIHEKFGIYLKDEKISYVKMKLYPRVCALGFSSFRDYIQHVKYGSDSREEMIKIVSLLTNNETYFFREYPQLAAFRDYILKDLREEKLAKKDKKLRILSAGCSTGEEAYTIAMILYEHGMFFWGWDVNIIGMDINEKALEVARRGVYYEKSFRMTDSSYMKKFFSPNCGDYEAKNVLKKMIRFISGNIMEQDLGDDMQNFDAIFCRNVLIYFTDEKLKLALKNFHRALRAGGYLLLGHSETLTGVFDEFKAIRYPETIVYKK